jgi:hypothetical protein
VPAQSAVIYFVDRTAALLWRANEEDKNTLDSSTQHDPNASERMRGLASSYLSVLLRLYFVDKDNVGPAKIADDADSDAEENGESERDLLANAQRSKQAWQQSIESVVLPLLDALPALIDTIEGKDVSARQTSQFHADCGRTVAALKLLTFDEVLDRMCVCVCVCASPVCVFCAHID